MFLTSILVLSMVRQTASASWLLDPWSKWGSTPRVVPNGNALAETLKTKIRRDHVVHNMPPIQAAAAYQMHSSKKPGALFGPGGKINLDALNNLDGKWSKLLTGGKARTAKSQAYINGIKKHGRDINNTCLVNGSIVRNGWESKTFDGCNKITTTCHNGELLKNSTEKMCNASDRGAIAKTSTLTNAQLANAGKDGTCFATSSGGHQFEFSSKQKACEDAGGAWSVGTLLGSLSNWISGSKLPSTAPKVTPPSKLKWYPTLPSSFSDFKDPSKRRRFRRLTAMQ